jgi:CubicO group peptidase (beta-lactamase class C family)
MRTVLGAVCVLIAAAATTAFAQDPPADHAWVERWAQMQLGAAVQEGRASQAGVAVVVPGAAPFISAYGTTADRSVDAAQDQFLIASVTKTFTAIAIAQLLHEGRIASLDDPANRYLHRAPLPGPLGAAVTIRQLLTHTAGFEERGFGVTRQGDAIPATAAQAAQRFPRIVRPPGGDVVYANIDPAILGMIVEDITGLTMQQYMAERILEPLGMDSSVLNYAPDGGAALVAPRRLSPGGLRTLPQTMNAPFYAPTGSIQTTPADMARLLTALLGASEAPTDEQTVSAALRTQLFTPLAGNHPALDQLAMAFFVQQWNGERVVQHAGAFEDFNAWLVLLPDRGIGMFAVWAGGPTVAGAGSISFNGVRDSFLAAALGPYQASPALEDQTAAQAFLGRYWTDRRPQSSAEMMAALPAVTVITSGPEGLLVNGQGPFRLIAPDVIEGPTDGTIMPQRFGLRGDTLLQGAAVAQRVSGPSDPGVISTMALGALGASLLGFAALAWRRGLSKWAAFALPFAAATIPFAAFWPGPTGGGIVEDILAGRSLRFILMAIAAWISVAAVIVMSIGAWRAFSMIAAVGGALGRWAGRLHRVVLLAAGVTLAFVFVFLKAFVPPM